MATMQGVYITVLGMAILFAALLILMLAAMGLERLFRPREVEEVSVKSEEKPSSEKELVAAMAVAIALKLKAQSPNRKSQIANRKSQIALSAWKFWGRYRQLMSSREVKGHREQ
jgi:sodium pump decarboxylase gamma subunit